MEPTIEQARKIKELVTEHGLSSGLGNPVMGEMCIEALKNHVFGLPHSDKPLPCVDAYDNRLAIRINDRYGWSDERDRGAGLWRIGIMQLGTAGTDRMPMKLTVQEEIIRHIVPIALRAAARMNPQHAADIEAAAARCEAEGTKDSSKAARDLCRGIYRERWSATTTTTATATAADAADAAADAADAAALAAAADDDDAAAATLDAAADANAAARTKARREVLLTLVACVERAYRKTGSRGVELLNEIEG